LLTRIAARLYPQLKEEIDLYAKQIKDSTLLQYVSSFNRQYLHELKKGDQPQGFYLFNEYDQAFRLADFRDSLVYISFWATWCKPCIDEFPVENKLVEQFSQQAVKFISICLDSEKEKWQERIQKHGLKTLNLFAEANWNKILKEKYAVVSYPHYVLIDKEGLVLQNKTLKPSEKADSLILHYLN
jgi:thiol-disulfide isomerase/thioredoxin